MQPAKPSEIKALTILHLALIVAQVIFLLISLVISYTNDISSVSPLKEYANQLITVCIVLGIAGYLGGNMIFRKRLDAINENANSLRQKINDYRAACIIRWALLEAPILFCIILFYVTNNSIQLFVAAAFIILFFTTRPSLQKVASDLRVNEEEIKQMTT